MQPSTYQVEFARTLAPVFFPDNLNPAVVGAVLRDRASTAKTVDALKRALYYNNTERLDALMPAMVSRNTEGLDYNIDPETLHAILGMEGEVAEITEAALLGNRAKIVDEAGDFFWFLALLCRKHDITFEELMAGNIAKLAKRYPDKFTTDLAVNRDLDAEAGVFQS